MNKHGIPIPKGVDWGNPATITQDKVAQYYEAFEGKLFLSRAIFAIGSVQFMVSETYYTLHGGVVYEVRETELKPSGDNPLSLCSCVNLGQYIGPYQAVRNDCRMFAFDELATFLKASTTP